MECASDGAEAVAVCQEERQKRGKVTNIIIFDWFDYGGSDILNAIDAISNLRTPFKSTPRELVTPPSLSHAHRFHTDIKEYDPKTFEADVGDKQIVWVVYNGKNATLEFVYNVQQALPLFQGSVSVLAVNTDRYPGILKVLKLQPEHVPTIAFEDTTYPYVSHLPEATLKATPTLHTIAQFVAEELATHFSHTQKSSSTPTFRPHIVGKNEEKHAVHEEL